MQHRIAVVAHAGPEAPLGHIAVVAQHLGLLPLHRIVQLGEHRLRIADEAGNELDPRRRRQRDAFDRCVTIDLQAVGGAVTCSILPAKSQSVHSGSKSWRSRHEQ